MRDIGLIRKPQTCGCHRTCTRPRPPAIRGQTALAALHFRAQLRRPAAPIVPTCAEDILREAEVAAFGSQATSTLGVVRALRDV